MIVQPMLVVIVVGRRRLRLDVLLCSSQTTQIDVQWAGLYCFFEAENRLAKGGLN